MDKIYDALFIMLLGLVWLGPPVYWGYINGNFLAIPIWSVMLAFAFVSTGWRHRKRGSIISFLNATVFAVIGVVPAFVLGRAIALHWGILS